MVWLQNNLVNIVIITLVAGLLYLCARSLWKDHKKGLPSCACGKNCAHCALACAHGKAKTH
ncbi:MAG: FeoB-associated Cys-rich membrane protein [Erysipelotrichaceae bacterium]|nr:FeoB-associated Cys-rich membrane protein [Erysipelotrichaceae bacterium]